MMKAITRVVRSAYRIPGAGPAAATTTGGGACQLPPAGGGAGAVGGGAGAAGAIGGGDSRRLGGHHACGLGWHRGIWVRSSPDRIRHRQPPSPVLVRRLGGSIERALGAPGTPFRVPSWGHFGRVAEAISTGSDREWRAVADDINLQGKSTVCQFRHEYRPNTARSCRRPRICVDTHDQGVDPRDANPEREDRGTEAHAARARPLAPAARGPPARGGGEEGAGRLKTDTTSLRSSRTAEKCRRCASR